MCKGAGTESPIQFNAPPVDKLQMIRDATEVYPGTEYAVLVVRAQLDDGTFAVWSERRVSCEPCTSTAICLDTESSLAAFRSLVEEIVAYAHPEARA